MSRYEHFLAPSKAGRNPDQIVTIDCQSSLSAHPALPDRQIETLSAWHASSMRGKDGHYGRGKSFVGTDANELWNRLTVFAAHSGSTLLVSWRAMRVASLLGIWSRIENGSVRIVGHDSRADGKRVKRWTTPADGCAVMEDPPTILRIEIVGCQSKLTWIDCRNLGIDRTTEPDDYGVWCSQLLEGLRDIVRQLRVRDLGGLKMTAGSQATHSWRVRGFDRTILAHARTSVLDMERAAYYGGRCECYRIGEVEGPVYHLDFRSMYPSVCAAEEVPICLQHMHIAHRQLADLATDQRLGVIAQCVIRTGRPDYPVRRNGQTLWPIGTFATVLAGPELRRAVLRGDVVQIMRGATYRIAPALSSFALEFLSARYADGLGPNAISAQWAKAVGVCLPGKLGQRGYSWRYYPDAPAQEPWASWIGSSPDGTSRRYRSLDWRVYGEEIAPNSDEAIPAIAAWVTSAARVKMLDAIETAHRINIYYCDTDSLMSNERGYQLLLDSGMVANGTTGLLQIKGVHNSAGFYGIKHYHLDGELKCSGLPSGALYESHSAGWRWYQLHTRSALREGHEPRAEAVLRPYNRDTIYPLGHVDPSGEVTPFLLGD